MRLFSYVLNHHWQAKLPLLLALTLSAGPADAGGYTACDSPFMFGGAAANIIPLEYLATAADASAEGEGLEQLQETAQRLAWLVKLDSWHQPTYGSLGVVAHMFFDRTCDPDEVLSRLLAGGAAEPAATGQIIVMLQGKIFIEDEKIFLQSRLRGLRRDAVPYSEATSLSGYFEPEKIVASLSDGFHRLGASLPPLDITFAPRAMTLAELDEIDSIFEQASLVYDEASLESPSEPLYFDPEEPRAFQIEFVDGGRWLRIEDPNSGFSGYVRSDPEASFFLHQRMPELDFLNGMLGYLRTRQAHAGAGDFRPPPKTAWEQARESFGRYLESEKTAEEREARALALALIGVLSAVEGGDWAESHRWIQAAVESAPYRSEYRNMLGVVDAQLCCAALPSGEFGDPARSFADSLSLAPDNLEALENLQAFLATLDELQDRSGVPPGIDASRLAERRQIVQNVVSALHGFAPAQKEGIVYVSVEGKSVGVPLSIAAQVCGIDVSVLEQKFSGTVDVACEIDQETAANIKLNRYDEVGR